MTTIIPQKRPRSRDVGRFVLRMAETGERPSIYRLRHDVYATELGQHPENPQGMLSDALDEFNHYIVACEEGEIVGFVSLTPPGHGRYSVDKYVPREELPVPADDRLYEVRLLTVAKSHRSGPVTALLMHAALRWIDEHGGRSIVAIGRREVLGLYEKAGFVPAGRAIRSGQVTYELMSTDVERRARSLPGTAGSLSGSKAVSIGALSFRCFAWKSASMAARFSEPSARISPRSSGGRQSSMPTCWTPGSRRLPGASVAGGVPGVDNADVAPTRCEGLVRAISKARGIPERSLAPGAGSSALIYLAFREWLDPSSRVLLLDPTYGEYAHVLENIVGCRVDRLRLDRAAATPSIWLNWKHACGGATTWWSSSIRTIQPAGISPAAIWKPCSVAPRPERAFGSTRPMSITLVRMSRWNASRPIVRTSSSVNRFQRSAL